MLTASWMSVSRLSVCTPGLSVTGLSGRWLLVHPRFALGHDLRRCLRSQKVRLVWRPQLPIPPHLSLSLSLTMSATKPLVAFVLNCVQQFFPTRCQQARLSDTYKLRKGVKKLAELLTALGYFRCRRSPCSKMKRLYVSWKWLQGRVDGITWGVPETLWNSESKERLGYVCVLRHGVQHLQCFFLLLCYLSLTRYSINSSICRLRYGYSGR